MIFFSCKERKSSFSLEIGQELEKYEALKAIVLSDPTRKDSVLHEIYLFDHDTLKSNLIFDISYKFYLQQDSLNFRVWNKITLDHSTRIKDTSSIAESYWDLANFFYKEKVLDSSYYYYNVARNLYEQENDNYQVARMLINLATIQRDIKDYQTSEVTTIQALQKLEPFNKKYQLYLAYNNLGITNNHLEQFNEALKYHRKALELAEDLQDGVLIALSLNNIGVVYKNLEQFHEATESYKEAQKVDDLKTKYPELNAMLIDNLAYSRFKMGDSKNVEKDLINALDLRKQINHFSGIAVSYLHLGDFYLNSSDTSRAFTNYMNSRKISIDKGLNEEFLQSTLALARLGGNESSNFYNEYIQKAAEFQQEEREVKNRFAKIRYQTEELVAETKRLSEQRIWITAFSVLAILFLLLLYYLRSHRAKNKELLHEQEQRIANEEIYKLMLKQQSKLEEGRQQERKRISSDLHDGVISRLYGTRLSLEFLDLKMTTEKSEKFASLTNELQKIEKEVREISHDLVSENFSRNLGLIGIIKSLIDEKNQLKITNFNFQNDIDISWEEVNEELRLDLYRIIQETTQNILKYSGAKEAWIRILEKDFRLILTIRDDGCGFSVAERNKGIGLKNIELRVKKWDGEFFITSSPGQGTEIKIEFPFKKGSYDESI